MSPEWKVVISYFAFNVCLLATAAVIGLGCLIAIHRQIRSKQTFLPFNLFLYAVTIGFSVIITLLFILALSGWLITAAVFTAITLSAVMACIYTIANSAFFHQIVATPRTENNNHTLYYISLCGTVIIALFNLLTNVHETGFSDGTSYHLPYAQYYLDHHGLATNINLRYPYQSHNANLLYSFGLTYADSIYCQTLHALFGVLTALVIFSFTIEAGIAAPLAMVAAASFLNLDLFINLSNSANVDLISGFFITMAIYTIMTWQKHQTHQIDFIVSAMCLGMAMGTKYLSTLFALPLAFFILYSCRSMRLLFIYAATTALFGLWWYIRSYLMTGNPIHPFATEIFGYYLWNEEDTIVQMEALTSNIIEKTLVNLATLPQQFSKDSFAFTGLQYWLYGFYIAPLFWMRLSSFSKSLMLFAWPFLIFWFYSSQSWRYITPLAPLLLVINFDLIQILLDGLTRMIRKVYPATPSLETIQPIIMGLVLAFIMQQATLYIRQLKQIDKWPVTARSQDILLKRMSFEYQLFSVANQYFDRDKNVFLFDFFQQTYFLKANAVGEHFGPNRVRDIIKLVVAASNTSNPDNTALKSVMERFSSLGIDGFIIDDKINYNRQLFNEQFEHLYSNPVGSVYRIRRR